MFKTPTEHLRGSLAQKAIRNHHENTSLGVSLRDLGRPAPDVSGTMGSQTEENGESELSTSIHLSPGPDRIYNMTLCVGNKAQSSHLVNHGHSALSPTQGFARDSSLSKATYLFYNLGQVTKVLSSSPESKQLGLGRWLRWCSMSTRSPVLCPAPVIQGRAGGSSWAKQAPGCGELSGRSLP